MISDLHRHKRDIYDEQTRLSLLDRKYRKKKMYVKRDRKAQRNQLHYYTDVRRYVTTCEKFKYSHEMAKVLGKTEGSRMFTLDDKL